MAKIPHKLRLKPEVIEEGKNQRSIAGSFIESLLDVDARHITGLDPVEIVKCTTSGKLSSLAVMKAFQKRAAFAHQLVCKSTMYTLKWSLTEEIEYKFVGDQLRCCSCAGQGAR
jgi:hypothetical protein